jgi:hypothetical protein
MIDLAYETAVDRTADPGVFTPAVSLSTVHPQSLLDLPPGEARESLLAVHGELEAKLPPNDLAIYEAAGGSTSFLPLSVLGRGHVTVVDTDENQIRNNHYAPGEYPRRRPDPSFQA